jgi:ParB-like chromosome segregation protein Spo0J
MQIVKISEVKPNPKNPRIIKDGKFQKLVKSIQEFPDMLNKRPLVVFTDVDNKYVVLGGNMRLKACKEIGLKEIPIIVADEWTEEQKNEFLIKDNVGFGEWDWDSLANEWDAEKLDDWGLQIYGFEDNMTNNEDYEGLDQLSKLDKFMNAELKRMFLVYENETFEKVVKWFEEKQTKYNCEDNSELILKLMENENI